MSHKNERIELEVTVMKYRASASFELGSACQLKARKP
jgi:hypothetical protein